MSLMKPAYKGKAEMFFTEPALPQGLSLHLSNGEITKVGDILSEQCNNIVIGVKNSVGSSSTTLKICTIPEEEEEPERLGNQPKRLFWQFMTGSMAFLTVVIMLSILNCIHVNKRKSKRISKK